MLYEGIEEGLSCLQQAGFELVVITNQSGIARGLFDEAALQLMHDHLSAELTDRGIHIGAFYYCPHHPDGVVPELARDCDCRKPRPGMLLRAANERDIDLRRSWFVGDILDDVEAGNRAGCRTVLVDLGTEPLPPSLARTPDMVARDTAHALQLICGSERLGFTPAVYWPARWWLRERAVGA